MSEKSDYDHNSLALGIPEKAFDLTVFSHDELMRFLKLEKHKAYTDHEKNSRFYMFYRQINDLESTVRIIADQREELRKIFAPEDIISANDLGFWRIIYTTNMRIQFEPAKKKLTNVAHGPHYSLESRNNQFVIRAKGRSFKETEGLFVEAVEKAIVEEIDY